MYLSTLKKQWWLRPIETKVLKFYHLNEIRSKKKKERKEEKIMNGKMDKVSKVNHIMELLV